MGAEAINSENGASRVDSIKKSYYVLLHRFDCECENE